MGFGYDEDIFGYLMSNRDKLLRSYSSTGFNPNDDLPEEALMGTPDSEEESLDGPRVPTGAPEEGLKGDDHFQILKKKKKHKWSAKEMEEIRKSCETSIVHDFSDNDFYHMNDEQRAEIDALAEMRSQMSTLATVYRRVDNFILGMRIIMKAIYTLERKFNMLYSTEEFFKMLASGKVYPVGFVIPRLRTLNKYDPKVLAAYISDETLDPEDLLTPRELEKKHHTGLEAVFEDAPTEEEHEAKLRRLFTDEEILRIEEVAQNPPTIKTRDIPEEFIKGYSATRSYFGQEQKPKFKKKMDKKYADMVHDLLNYLETSPGFTADSSSDIYSQTYASSASILLGGAFEPEEKEPNPIENMRYTGSLRDPYAFEAFRINLENTMLDSMYGQDSYQTNQSMLNKKLFGYMENNGINVVELRRALNLPAGASYVDQDSYFRDKRIEESNMAKESDICTRIIGMNDDKKFLKIIRKAEEDAADAERGIVE